MADKLIKLLHEVVEFAGNDFSGIGLIVWDGESELPTFPLRANAEIHTSDSAAANLAKISSPDSDFHDGFHLLTMKLEVVRIAQYFSPPIIHNISVNRERRFGGRYLAALFGSKITGAELTAIATPALGIAVFKDGQEIYFEGS